MYDGDKEILAFVERIPGLVFCFQDLSVLGWKPLGATRPVDLRGETRPKVPERKLGMQRAFGLEAHDNVLQSQFLLYPFLAKPLDNLVPIGSLCVKVAEFLLSLRVGDVGDDGCFANALIGAF